MLSVCRRFAGWTTTHHPTRRCGHRHHLSRQLQPNNPQRRRLNHSHAMSGSSQTMTSGSYRSHLVQDLMILVGSRPSRRSRTPIVTNAHASLMIRARWCKLWARRARTCVCRTPLRHPVFLFMSKYQARLCIPYRCVRRPQCELCVRSCSSMVVRV